jgi:5-methyltetrahydrofolate--homocysteine methyltransferase
MQTPITDIIAEKGWCVASSMGPAEELFEPMGTLTDAGTVAYFAEQADALADGGAQVIWIETMSSLEEVAAAAAAARNGFAGLRHADL